MACFSYLQFLLSSDLVKSNWQTGVIPRQRDELRIAIEYQG